MRVNLTIENFAICAPWINPDQDIIQQLKKININAPEKKINTISAPAGVKRRMSNISKMVINSTLDQLDLENIDYAIFSSQHGEYHHRYLISECVRLNEAVSPTVFSQSVHNTSAGLYSIFKKCRKPSLTITPGKNVLSSALFEAYSYLKQNPNARILVVSFDEAVTELFAQRTNQKAIESSLALIVSNQKNNLSIELNSTKKGTTQHSESLDFIQWWCQGSGATLRTRANINSVAWQRT